MCDCVSLYDILLASSLLLLLLLSSSAHEQDSLLSGDRYAGLGVGGQAGRGRWANRWLGWLGWWLAWLATFVVSANFERQDDAIAVTCSPTPWGNISRLFGKSTACFILACNFRWVFLWLKGDKSQNQLEINVAAVFPAFVFTGSQLTGLITRNHISGNFHYIIGIQNKEKNL